jgi:hypothetical protein
MTQEFYSTLQKTDIMKSPSAYAWNCILRYIQFSQEELVAVKKYVEIPELIQFQKSVTKAFLLTHFKKEIDECLEVDSFDIERYVEK